MIYTFFLSSQDGLVTCDHPKLHMEPPLLSTRLVFSFFPSHATIFSLSLALVSSKTDLSRFLSLKTSPKTSI